MALNFFKSVDSKEKTDSVEQLIANSSPRQDFFMMTILSIVMATFGLLLDSAAIIIGSMLVAPLLYPLLSLGLGVVLGDMKLIGRSSYTVAKATVLGIASSAIIAFFFLKQSADLTSEILARVEPSLEYLLVAIVAGFAASYATIKQEHNERLPGVAISVALIPPLAVVGIGFAQLNIDIISQSFVLYFINVIGVALASIVTFTFMQMYTHRKVVEKAVKKDEKDIKKEEAEAEEG